MKASISVISALVLLSSCMAPTKADELRVIKELQTESSIQSANASKVIEKQQEQLTVKEDKDDAEKTSTLPIIDRNKRIDRMFYTINRDLKLDAPIWMNTEEIKNKYGERYMRTLIKEAHNIASRYLRYDDHQAYNSFMMLALTFPLHEGLYMSYRETNDEKGLCNQDSQNGNIMFKQTKKKIYDEVNLILEEDILDSQQNADLELLKQNNEEAYKLKRQQLVDDFTMIKLNEKKQGLVNGERLSNYKNFVNYLQDSKAPFIIPNCKTVENDEVIRQMIRGGDGTDIGPMQLSLRWHYEHFLGKKMYLSLEETMKYGLNYIHNGFKKIYYDTMKNKKERRSYYKCIMRNKWNIDFEKLVRGTWAGKYNQGQVRKACRIEVVEELEKLTKTKYRAKVNAERIKEIKRHADYHFNNNLNKVKGFTDQTKIGYMESLSFELSETTKSAVNEIIENFTHRYSAGEKHKNVAKLVNNL